MKPQSSSPKAVPFQEVIQALLDNDRPFPLLYLRRFSDLNPEDVAEIKKIWEQIKPDRRVALLEDLKVVNETDTLVCFDEISRLALKDSDPRARVIATRLLWESNDTSLAPIFIAMMNNDVDEAVRAAAASALGSYVYRGELEEVSSGTLRKVENALLTRIKEDDTPQVRRHCLEALGFSSRREVPELIQKAYEDKDEFWQASALFAMGRSASSRWHKAVLEKLEDPSPEIQLEAIRSAGELSIARARRPLIDLLRDFEDLDEGIRGAAVWSLSQIGGKNVRNVLEKLLQKAEDDDEVEMISDAIDNLEFVEGISFPGLFDFGDQTDPDNFKIIDLSDPKQLDNLDEDEDI